MSEGWCGRGDSNPHALAGASPSRDRADAHEDAVLLGNLACGVPGAPRWRSQPCPNFLGFSRPCPTESHRFSHRSQFGGGKYLAMLKLANLANRPIQNHVWGDILRRQVTGELRMGF